MDKEFLPTTLEDALKLIKRLDRELVALKTEKACHGLAAVFLRQPSNFTKIDDVLEKVKDRPFSFKEIYEEWLDITELGNEGKTVVTNLRQHFTDLLKLNGFVYQVGGKGRSTLWRLNKAYTFALRSAKTLKWRSVGQVEGTYLIPE